MTPAQFVDSWRAHFGAPIHPLALSLAGAASEIKQKPDGNARLCWDVLGGQASVALAVEVKEDLDGGITSKLHLPTGMPSAFFRETAWHGWDCLEPFAVGDVISNGNRYCVLRLSFAPDSISLEFAFGGAPRHKHNETETE